MVRGGEPLGGPGHIRVTYGTRAENERFLAPWRRQSSASPQFARCSPSTVVQTLVNEPRERRWLSRRPVRGPLGVPGYWYSRFS